MKDPTFYKMVRPLLNMYIKLYKPTIVNKDYIPISGRVILVGNHTSNLDPILVASCTRRCVHFFAKDSLYKGIKKPVFKGLGIIPVDRTIKDKFSLESGYKLLNNDLVVGIFPEGTINRTNDVTMPFKFGTVKMASLTNSIIVPFIIINKYKFLNKSVKIEFLNPYKLESDDLELENNKLRKIIENAIIKNRGV